MIKAYSGEGRPKGQGNSVRNLCCQAAYNWDWPDKLTMAAQDGADVWPMIQNVAGSVERYLAWHAKHRVSCILLENEPFTQKGLRPEAFARWVLDVASPVIQEAGRDARQIFGGFLIEYPATYADIRGDVRGVANAIHLAGVDTMAFHPYLAQAPRMDEVPAAAKWFEDQIAAIAHDWKHFAITEWGVPNGKVSYSGRDVPALAEYMRRGWDAMLEYNCHSSAWFMGGPNTQFSEYCDSILCWESGLPKPLGMVYRDLPSYTPVIEPPPWPDDDLEVKVADLEIEVTTLNSEVAAIDADQEAHEAKIATLETEIAHLTRRLAELEEWRVDVKAVS